MTERHHADGGHTRTARLRAGRPVHRAGAAGLMAAAGSLLGFGPAGAAATSHGAVNVLYAGSLVATMGTIGPAFERATGYNFVGYAAGSTALASEVKAGTYRADVFISAGTATNASLEGPANGNWESWFIEFGSTQLLLGYNPRSRFARALATEPWYRVVTEPGFLLGRTDPAVDPKGALTVQALDEAAARYHDPALRRLATTQDGVFPEESLIGRLQAGQLDAGFFFGVEAKAAKLATTGLGKVGLASPYTVAILHRAPDPKGAAAFVSFLLGNRGGAILRREGLRLDSPARLFGRRTAVPAPLRKLVS